MNKINTITQNLEMQHTNLEIQKRKDLENPEKFTRINFIVLMYYCEVNSVKGLIIKKKVLSTKCKTRHQKVPTFFLFLSEANSVKFSLESGSF